MSFINYSQREINCKIVYYGPGLCGKTTNLEYINDKTNPAAKGRLISLATETDRTLFFDFLPLSLGSIRGFATRFHLYAGPGQEFYNASRLLILKGVDGIIMVMDSQHEREEANRESFANLRENLSSFGYDIEAIPLVLAYNKRDLPNAASTAEMECLYNPERRWPAFETVATVGTGVFGTLKAIAGLVLSGLRRGGDVRLAPEGKLALAGATSTSSSLRIEGANVIQSEWNPVRFVMEVEGESKSAIQLRFVTTDACEIRSFAIAGVFELPAGVPKQEGLVWVRPRRTGPVDLGYEIDGASRSKMLFARPRSTEGEALAQLPQIGILTFMCVDVAKSGSLWEDKEVAMLLMDNLRFNLAGAIGTRGKVRKSIGDGFVVTFDTPSLAVAAARALRRLSQDREGESGQARIELRFGIDIGEVILSEWDREEETELKGAPVTMAWRMCAAAAGGEIFVSPRAYSIVVETQRDQPLVADERTVDLRNLGPCRVHSLR